MIITVASTAIGYVAARPRFTDRPNRHAICTLRRHRAVGGNRKSQTRLSSVTGRTHDIRQENAVGENILCTGAVRVAVGAQNENP